jgi:hypothetical protein
MPTMKIEDMEWGPDARAGGEKVEKITAPWDPFGLFKKTVEERLVANLYYFKESDEFKIGPGDEPIRSDYNGFYLEKLQTNYGSAADVLRTCYFSTMKARDEYVQNVIKFAEPDITPKELHIKAGDAIAEAYLIAEFEKYMKDMGIEPDKDAYDIMIGLAREKNVFSNRDEPFRGKNPRHCIDDMFKDSAIAYLLSQR